MQIKKRSVIPNAKSQLESNRQIYTKQTTRKLVQEMNISIGANRSTFKLSIQTEF